MEEIVSRIGKLHPAFDVFKLKDVLVKNDAGDWGNEPDHNAIGIIRSTNFTNEGKLDLDDVAYRTLKPSKREEKRLSIKEIIVERSGGSDTQPVGRVGFITKSIEDNNFAFANFIQRIAFDESVEPLFVFYCLQQMYEMGVTASMQYQTTGIRNLDWKLYVKSLLPKPPKPEQTAIASILTKVDDVIAATEKSIQAAERLKKALMQNLLTGKIKRDGTWRKEDEFYVHEKFGKVPMGWEVKKVKDVAICLDAKRKPIKAEDRKAMRGEYRYYGAAGIIDYINDYIFDGRYILFGEDGENLLSRKVPQAFIVEGKFWVNNHAHILAVVDGISDVDYLCLQLEHKNYESIVYGSAQPKINKSDLNKIKILLPLDLNEQKAVVDKICRILSTIENKQIKIQTLQRLKKSLMQNLLTGKVRLRPEVIAQHASTLTEIQNLVSA